MSPADIAVLGEREALQRLELLAMTSRILDTALDDYDEAMRQVAEACVVEFADLCAIEVIGPGGQIRCAAYVFRDNSALTVPAEWSPVGRLAAPDRASVLAFSNSGGSPAAQSVRQHLAAQSMIVAPIIGGGLTLGWLVAATGPDRRGFRPSALRVGSEVASRLATAMQRVILHREMQASVREQGRTVRRLRRLAAAATNLAGADTPQAVLDIACVEACVIHEADGAVARWAKGDGTLVTASSGQVDLAVAETAFDAVASRRAARGAGWVAYPLPNSDPWQQAALVVFVGDEFAADEELVLSSLASLIPVAFERALGTEAALSHEARLRAVVETSPVALIGLDAAGQVNMANRSAQDLFGWADPIGSYVEPSLRASLTELTATVLDTRSVVNRSVTSKNVELSLSAAPLPGAAPGEPPSVIVAGVDLTDIRRAERALVQAQRLEAMGQVAGRVAHDFNNLLTLIIGYADLLRRGIDDPKQHMLIENIEAATQRAAALTQQMLDMTRQKVDSGVVIDLGSHLTQLDAVLARLAGPKVDLRISAPPDVIKVRLDPSEMEQIVVNLVLNACDAMDGVGRVDVTVELDEPTVVARRKMGLPPEPLALLIIADDGPGMSEEVLARCLEPFFTTKGRGRGSGLGLPTVYGLVKERGGHLEIDSQPGAGTAICIWLPVYADAALTESAEGDESWPADRRLAGRVLLVEDEDELRDMAARTLTSIGLTVVSAASAELALEALDGTSPFDALVTDVILPGLSGVQLAALATAQVPDLPVMYVTAYPGGANGAIVPEDGHFILRKPYRPDTLRIKVAELLEG
jgi:PAS domain S-box-containing protein